MRYFLSLLALFLLVLPIPAQAEPTPTAYAYEHLEFMLDSTFGGKPNPVHQLHVRQALALALNPAALTASALHIPPARAARMIAWTPWVRVPGFTEAGTNAAINGMWDPVRHADIQPGTAVAIADARILIAHSHFPHGFTVTLTTTGSNPIRMREEAAITASWKVIGVTVVPDNGNPAKIFADWDHGGVLVHGEFQVALMALDIPPDPSGLRFNLTSPYIDRLTESKSVTNGNYSGIRDRIIDTAFANAAAATTSTGRADAYKAVQTRLNREAYWVGLYFSPAR